MDLGSTYTSNDGRPKSTDTYAARRGILRLRGAIKGDRHAGEPLDATLRRHSGTRLRRCGRGRGLAVRDVRVHGALAGRGPPGPARGGRRRGGRPDPAARGEHAERRRRLRDGARRRCNSHHERALQRGARILEPPADHPYGERQYTAEDNAGHRWTFSQSIADVAPEDWGGTPAASRDSSRKVT